MKFNILEPFKNLVHAVSTRMGGMSKDPYSTLNLGFHTDDNPDNILLNREILCNRLDIPLDYLVCAKQVHKANVSLIEKGDWGKGSEDYDSGLNDTDAMVTDAPDIFLMVLVADCPAVVFYDSKKKAVGIAHAGWRSTLSRISQKVVKKMCETYKSKPQDIICGVSPSIGPCCYEVGKNLVDSFAGQGFGLADKCVEQRNNKFFLNLWEINRVQLIESGIKEDNIEVARLCNSCHSELFYSARKEGKTGRYAVLIGAVEQSRPLQIPDKSGNYIKEGLNK